MNNKEKIEISKFIALVLRHKPSAIGKKVDHYGYMSVADLIEGINKTNCNNHLNFQILSEIVEEDKKQRYSFSDDKLKIRANQGHSFPVDLRLENETPPDILYHGTGEKYLESILQNGLIKKSRQYVHLSGDYDTAVSVGKRHGTCVVLYVDSKQMNLDGIKFYKSTNGVWLTDFVDKKYLKLKED